ncbi:MAG: hypothetical protein M1297_10055 [Nitrospirae bacterium]|nr:hypothetical protein [Nitrospirota bacterium]
MYTNEPGNRAIPPVAGDLPERANRQLRPARKSPVSRISPLPSGPS